MAPNVLGIWKIKASLCYDDDMKQSWRTVEDLLADDSVEDKDSYKSVFVFNEDGYLLSAVPTPDDMTKEEVDEMVAAGEVEKFGDRYLVVEKHRWKEEDGKIYYDSGTTGEFLGEEVSPWIEIAGTDEELEFLMYKLVRA